jgi:hypothetical protein
MLAAASLIATVAFGIAYNGAVIIVAFMTGGREAMFVAVLSLGLAYVAQAGATYAYLTADAPRWIVYATLAACALSIASGILAGLLLLW